MPLRLAPGRMVGILLSLLALSASAATFAQTPAATPTSASASDTTTTHSAQRVADLLALVEGPNSPQVRRTGARELLRLNEAGVEARILALLSGSNALGKAAVAAALADLPETFRPEYVAPLLTLLADSEDEVRRAAGDALAACGDVRLVARLSELARSESASGATRRAAVQVLGRLSSREAVAALVEIATADDLTIVEPGLAALESATGRDFRGDPSGMLAWWDAVRGETEDQWRQRQLDRAARQAAQARAYQSDLEARLVSGLRDAYQRLPADSVERSTQLAALLADPLPIVRLLALDLVQSDRAAGRTLTADVLAALRAALADQDVRVRAVAVGAVAAIRDAADETVFLAMLASEAAAPVRRALVNGLGYIGGSATADALVPLLRTAEPDLAADIVTSLGRLAERSALDPERRDAVADHLLRKYNETASEHVRLREQLLSAMGRAADPRFADVAVAALARDEPAAVRLAAIRCVAVLADPAIARAGGETPRLNGSNGAAPRTGPDAVRLTAALLPLIDDGDPLMRRAAVDAFGPLMRDETQLARLWQHCLPEGEPDEGTRTQAWKHVTAFLVAQPWPVVERWLDRLPADPALAGPLAIQVLTRVEKNLSAAGDRSALASARLRMARELARAERPGEARAEYLAALDDLLAVRPPDAAAAAVEIAAQAVLSQTYTTEMVDALAQRELLPDPGDLWCAVEGPLRQRLDRGQCAAVLASLSQLRGNTPPPRPPIFERETDRFLAEAQALAHRMRELEVAALIEQCRIDPADAAARTAIEAHGEAAAALVRQRLRAVVAQEPPEPQFERVLHDLLRSLDPDWPGFSPDASRVDKDAALQV